MIRIKNLINYNNFPIKLIAKEVNKFVTSKVKNLSLKVKDKIHLYFCNRMTEYYDEEENKLKDIIYNHVHSVNENSKVYLKVYYRNFKLKNLTTEYIATLVRKGNVTCPILDTLSVN